MKEPEFAELFDALFALLIDHAELLDQWIAPSDAAPS
jgi:hypothetical protein